ncbi:hypothetical protein ACFW04_011829 [Cataglyphis niger]
MSTYLPTAGTFRIQMSISGMRQKLPNQQRKRSPPSARSQKLVRCPIASPNRQSEMVSRRDSNAGQKRSATHDPRSPTKKHRWMRRQYVSTGCAVTHRKKFRSLYMASLDISKAFDSTYLEEDTWTSAPIHPKRGVRQGDPLSPVIFNIVTHQLLQKLSSDVGVRLGKTTVNATAFADDLLLFATTPQGLQQLINQHLPSLQRTDKWRYLGVIFIPERRTLCRPGETLTPLLENITRAPLKPQQRLFALRTMVIPKLYHQLALGSVTIGTLNKVDKMVRATVRKWLALLYDVPSAYFHATIRDGGLGVPSLRWSAPLQRRGRILAARNTHYQRGFDDYANEELARCAKRLTDHGKILNSTDLVNQRWANALYEKIDGGGLKESRKTLHQHQCRAGCFAQETLNHVLQQCHRTHASCIKRHDAILNYMEHGIRKSKYEIHREPHYHTTIGLRKPDLMVSEQADLDKAHKKKVDYYKQIQQDIKKKRNRGAKFEDLIRSFGMNVVNDAGQGPTFWTARGLSFIDVTLTSPSMNQFIGDWKVRPDWTTSDHNAVDIRLRVPKGSGRDRGAANMRFDIRRADWERFAESLTDLSRSKLEVLDLCSAIRVEEMAETMAAVLTEACAASMPRKRRFRKSNPWWTMELTTLKKRLKYRFSLREYSREVRKAKLASWRKFVTSHGNSEPWGFVYKHQAEKLRVEGVLSTLRCGEYSTKTLEETAGYLLDAHTPDDRENEDTLEQREIRLSSRISPDTADALFFTATEIAVAVKTFKSNKAPGLDLVEVSVLKTAALSTIYRGVFALTVAYAAAGWADLCTESDVRILKALQRQVLISTTGAYRTASWESLCVVAGVVPVDLLLREYTARYQVRIGNNARIGNVEIPAKIGKKVAFGEIREEAINMDVRHRLAAPSLESEYWSTQALTGHGDFRARLESLDLVDSDVCVCESGIDTVQHFLLDCLLFDAQREALRDFVPQSEWKWPEAAHFFSVYPGRDTMDRPSRGPRWWAYWGDRTVHPAHKIPQALLDFSISVVYARLGKETGRRRFLILRCRLFLSLRSRIRQASDCSPANKERELGLDRPAGGTKLPSVGLCLNASKAVSSLVEGGNDISRSLVSRKAQNNQHAARGLCLFPVPRRESNTPRGDFVSFPFLGAKATRREGTLSLSRPSARKQHAARGLCLFPVPRRESNTPRGDFVSFPSLGAKATRREETVSFPSLGAKATRREGTLSMFDVSSVGSIDSN